MEGLLINQQLRRLRPLLPSRRQAWRFPDAQTFVLPLAGDLAIWIFNRPPNPRFELRPEVPPAGRTNSGFQDLLTARASGVLQEARQRKLDRVLSLEFAGSEGFVTTEAVELVVELTGRNCNLILIDAEGTIIGAAREVRSDVNRFRQVVAGGRYLPPPPYEKLDPLKASREELLEVLAGQNVRAIPRLIDGIGPQLRRALAVLSAVEETERLGGGAHERVVDALERVTREPSEVLEETLGMPDARTMQRLERRRELRERLERQLGGELELVGKRLEDLARAREAADEADALRRRGDLLLAFANRVPAGSEAVTLPDFSGQPLRLDLDPARNAAGNAQGFYERARKREARGRSAQQREPELLRRRDELSRLLDRLQQAGDDELERLAQELLPKADSKARTEPFARYRGPHGFPVLVGRSSRENDLLTFKVARSRDIWLHVQGYQGAHVLIQAQGAQVPFDTILFAARLAAGHSKASESENVAVDYTVRKNVWRAKGAAPGAVHFTQHKTVFVNPSRRPVEEGE